MRAKQMLAEAAFGPETLSTMCAAFDQAWLEIEPSFAPERRDDAQVMLARAVINVSSEDFRGVDALKNAALKEMMELYSERNG